MALNITHLGKKTLQNYTLAAVPKYGNFSSTAPIAWEELQHIVYKENLIGSKTQMMGLSFGRPEDMQVDQLSYLAAVTIDEARNEARIHPPLIRYELKGGNYEVFRYTGPYEKIAEAMKEIVKQNDLVIRPAPFVELMIKTLETEKPENLVTDLYIPVS